jgi:PD-(D/E)XK nuclease superfamily
MVYELCKRGLRGEAERPVPLVHEGVVIDVAYRADLLVEDKVIVELKSVKEVAKVHKKQVKTYLKIARDKVNLDIFWLRDESLEDTANLPNPDILASEIVEDLQAALEQFSEIAEDVGE